MAVDYRSQPGLGGMGYDSKYSHSHFGNPWGANAPSNSPSLYQSSYHHSPTTLEQPQVSKGQSQMSMGYMANPAASSLGSGMCTPYNTGYCVKR